MYSINILACYTAATSNIILARTTFLDWAFDEWGTAGGSTVALIIIALAFFLDRKLNQSNTPENESATQDTSDDAYPTDPTLPPEEE